LALASQALRAGHQVKVLNLSAFAWPEVERVVRSLRADLYGLSCWTANRRGVALAAAEIKRAQPDAHVVVGGPHATPLAREMLEHHRDIDTVAIGESERLLIACARARRPAESRAPHIEKATGSSLPPIVLQSRTSTVLRPPTNGLTRTS
jgi:radical SAM superfamily enzyme YgiQ (UPF0313 family)